VRKYVSLAVPLPFKHLETMRSSPAAEKGFGRNQPLAKAGSPAQISGPNPLIKMTRKFGFDR